MRSLQTFGIAALVAATAVALTSAGCAAGDASTLDLSPHRIVVDATAFPSGWYLIGGVKQPAPEFLGQRDSSSAQYQHPSHDHPASQAVYCFARRRSAESAFAELANPDALSFGRTTSWRSSAELVYESAVADQFMVTCADVDPRAYGGRSRVLCRAIAQYDGCVSALYAWILPERMTYDTLQDVLSAVDAAAAEEIGRASDEILVQ